MPKSRRTRDERDDSDEEANLLEAQQYSREGEYEELSRVINPVRRLLSSFIFLIL